jgi:hypothetical protein
MQLRRLRSHRLTLLVAGALLASPLLAGCGFNYQTDRINTISAGTNDRSGTVDVLGAVVIAGQDNAGLFVASFVNKDVKDPIELDGVKQTDRVQPTGDEKPIEIAPGATVSLFQTGGLAIGGTFKAGEFLPVTVAFSNGQVTTVNVSVVPPCHQYSLDKLTELTLPTAAASQDATDPAGQPTPDVGTETEATESESASADESGDESAAESDPYSCDPLPAIEHGEGGE